MPVLSFLFSFTGRACRSEYLLFFVIAAGLTLGYLAAAYTYLAPPDIDALLEPPSDPLIPPLWLDRLVIASGIAALASEMLLFFMSLALSARRLHDRGKSAWWLIVFLFGTWFFDYLALSINYHCAVSSLPLYGLFDFLSLDIACDALPYAGRTVTLWGAAFPISGFAAALIAAGFTLWSFIELCLLPGNKGENRYGKGPTICLMK